MSSPDVIVIGAGVLGLASAAGLARAGRRVTVVDPGEVNASSVAAGMIAPALESLLDGADAPRAALLRRARDLWPDFARNHGLDLIRTDAEWRGEAGTLAAAADLGFDCPACVTGLTVRDDWRIEPGPALARLSEGVTRVQGEARRLSRSADGWRVDLEGRSLTAPIVVVATGAATPLQGLPPGAAHAINQITPIRGQIITVSGAQPSTVLRTEVGYLAPMGDQAVVGATMEPGRRDLEPDPVVTTRLLEVARHLGDGPAEAVQARVGIRGATPDGLPLVGATDALGLFLALAPRRNGWLLAPLTAQVITDAVEGRPPSPDAAALDPLRFNLVSRREAGSAALSAPATPRPRRPPCAD